MSLLYSGSNISLFDEKDRSKQQLVEDFYTRTVDQWQAWQYEANLDTRFENGDQSAFDEVYTVPASRRKYLSFNNIRPIKNMISGYQRRNRTSTVAIPIENGDEQTTDILTKLLMWHDRDQLVAEKESDAFSGALVTGMNMIHLWMDYRNDPISGDVIVDHISYNEFMVDPFIRKRDFSDCNGILRRSFVTMDDLKSMHPNKKALIEEIGEQSLTDGKFQFMPETFDFNKQNLIAYDEFYYRTYRTQRLLIDTDTGERYEWKSGDIDEMKAYIKQFPQIQYKITKIPSVKLVTLAGGKILYDGKNPLGIDEYPFVPFFGYFNPQADSYQWRMQGIVRGLRDAQFLYNRRKVIELDMAESQITTGYILKENSLINPKDSYLTGQGKNLILREDAQMTDIQKQAPIDIPQGFFQLSKDLQGEIQRISGISEENMGINSDELPGILAMIRQGAGVTNLQTLFDGLELSQKLLGKLRIKAFMANYTPDKIKRITNQEPTAQFYNKTFGKYDVAIEEGFNTTTQRQLQLAQMLQLKQIGVPIPNSELVKAATIQNKNEIVQAIQQEEQMAMQQQQQQAQLQMQQLAAQIKMAEAQATADQGLGIERLSRVQENQQLALERSAQAEENRAAARRNDEQAVLNMAKALKELDTIELDNFQKFIDLARMYNQFSKEQHQEDVASNMHQQYIEGQLRNLQSQALGVQPPMQ